MTRQTNTRETILTFIRDFRETKGYAPTVREIAESCHISSPSVVQYHLGRLEQGGQINKGREKFRSITLADTKDASGSRAGDQGPGTGNSSVPLLGTIAAGHPVWVPSAEMLESTADRIEVPAVMMKGKKSVYALQVRGNSMVDAMISDGDIVLMEPVHNNVKNGDVVAAWLKNEQEVTLKKIFFEEKQVRLQPCNPYMMPIFHKADNVEIQGRVIGVIRNY